MNKSKLSNIIAQIISVIFHPLLMPTYGLIILLNSGTHYSFIPEQGQKILYVLIFLTTFLIPVSIIPFLMSFKMIGSIEMEERKERIIPLAVSAASYGFSYYLIGRLPFHVPLFVKLLVLSPLILILINLLVNFKWKISSHMIGISGLLALVFAFSIVFYADLTNEIIGLTLVAGIVASARLKLNAHDPSQIYIGFLLGFSVMLIVVYYSL